MDNGLDLPRPSRREFLTLAGAATAAILEPVKRVAAAAKPVRITGVDVFPIRLPIPAEEVEAGKVDRYRVSRVHTDAGVRGYSFTGPDPALLDSHIRPALVGKDLFNVEEHLRNGLLAWGGVEQAIWDAVGKIANQPVYRLLGGSKEWIKLYLTTVWHGNPDQSHVSYDEQAAAAVKFKNAGFKGMKIRAWRPNPLDDAEACRVISQAVGPDFAIMFDRTAHAPESAGQKVWDYETGLKVARTLEKNGAYWLEEPFARDDYVTPARLCREVDLRITGGEGWLGLEPFHKGLLHRTYDIMQPEGERSGGIFLCRKVAMLAEAYHVPVILHGTMGLRLAGWLQASAAIGAEWQELVFLRPQFLPEELWNAGLHVLNTKYVYRVRDGEIQAPQLPGLGLDINEEAVERFRERG